MAGKTALMYAAEAGHTEVTSLLLYGQSECDGNNNPLVEMKDDEGLTTRRSVRIWGEEATSVDAANPQNP